MFERILVPLDGSAVAEAVLPSVAFVARRTGAEVLPLRVYPTEVHLRFDTVVTTLERRQEAEEYIARMEDSFAADGIEARGLVLFGDATETILNCAEEEQASLIAMSTHGRTGLARWVFGSVAEKVLRASPVPVLLLRSFPPDPGRTLSRGRLEELPFRTILVPLDGSEASLDALAAVKALAGPIDAHVTLLTVSENDEPASRWYSPGLRAEAAEKELKDACIPTRWEQRQGDPASEILKICDEQPVDLVAMSTHGRSGPTRWVLGSVTEKVLRAARQPILVVRRGRGSLPAQAPDAGVATR